MSHAEAIAPDRTLDQRRLALSRANEVRSYRAGVKRTLHGLEAGVGRRTVVQIITDPPAQMLTMKVVDLLLATPKIGRVKAHRKLRYVRVSPSKTLGGMSDRQRDELVKALLS